MPGKGRLRLTDYMPWSNDPRAAIHEVHRRLQCVEGSTRSPHLIRKISRRVR